MSDRFYVKRSETYRMDGNNVVWDDAVIYMRIVDSKSGVEMSLPCGDGAQFTDQYVSALRLLNGSGPRSNRLNIVSYPDVTDTSYVDTDYGMLAEHYDEFDRTADIEKMRNSRSVF